jgi:hypothetical protein
MPIADDWDFDYTAKNLNHIDGVLAYDTGGGRQAAVGEYVRGNTSGAIGRVIAVTGNTTSGTLTLTNTEGLWQDGETFEVMSFVNFDGVVDKASSLQGFRVGDTVVDQVTGSIVVRAIEYNTDGLGGGTLYGDSFTAFTNDSQLDISGGETNIALADGTGTDNDTALTTTQTNGTLAVPGTANTNDSVLIHYDAGVVAIPEQAIIEDATTGARGLVEQVYGVVGTGSVRIVDYDSTGGVWTDNNTLRADQVIAYNNQVAGQVFSVGDVVVGGTSGATGRVLLDTGTELILGDESGTWTTTEDLNVGGTKIAEANGTNTTLNLATINIPEGIRTEQRSDAVGGSAAQGGIYAGTDSLNVVRKLNSLYTLSQDTFDELLQMDDDEALDASVKGGAYSLVFDWYMPDLSTRFLRQGGLVDTSGANVWANPQTVGVQNKITDTAYLIDSSQTFRQPQLYIEQNGDKIPTWWLEGQIDVLVKVRSRNDTRFIAPATPTLGQLIPGGDPQVDGAYTVFNREFHTSTYDATQFNAAGGGVNTVALGTADDTATDRNPNGSHVIDYDAGSAATLLVGEEITTGSGNTLKVGQVVAQTGGAGATGTVEYVLKSGSQFANDEVLTGSISAKSITVNEPTSIGESVAGFSADIAFTVVDIAATPGGGTGITGTFIPGEPVTQAVSGATGRVVLVNTTTNVLYLDITSGTFTGDNDITGDTSSASWDAGTGATYPSATTFDADLNNGEGAQPYAGSVSMDITGANAQTVQSGYQYSKYLTRQEEEAYTFGGPGTADTGTIGNIYRKLKDAYAEVKPGAPLGPFTGSWALAQGWFLDTNYVAAADIRSFSVIDDNGVTRNPPNLQAMTISGVDNGWRVAAYRSTGSGSTTILRNEFDVGTVGSGNNQAGDSTVLVGANSRTVSPLPSDVPDSGALRILSPNDTGNYIRMVYSSVDRSTNIFTLTGTIGSFLTAAGETSTDLVLDDNVHVVFIEEQSAGTSVTNTIQYTADIDVVYKARLKGFKPFRSTGVFGTAGVTLGVVQNVDSIVDLP